jgi:hypothetical protein
MTVMIPVDNERSPQMGHGMAGHGHGNDGHGSDG